MLRFATCSGTSAEESDLFEKVSKEHIIAPQTPLKKPKTYYAKALPETTTLYGENETKLKLEFGRLAWRSS